MLKILIAISSFIFAISCNCQNLLKQEDHGIVSEKVLNLLGEKNFIILQNTEIILQFDIRKKLIEGTNDEYSNKVIFKDSLGSKMSKELLGIIENDDYYDWTTTFNETQFEPNIQLLLKGKGKRISLMFDEKSNILGFINLDGQTLVKLSPEFSNFIREL